MKDFILDAKLVAAVPYSDQTNSSFVKKVMEQISSQSLANKLPIAHGFSYWLKHLHGPALAIVILVVGVLISGAVYAAVQFAPSLIKLLGKETNPRGATEYSVQGFADCQPANLGPAAERFEIASDAPAMDDNEVKKILQAKCELRWLEMFPGKTWPTYGTNAEWKDGDTIYYTRLDMLGKVDSVSESKAGIVLGDKIVEHKPPEGEKIKAYVAGTEIPLSELKAGDTVFTISRISDIHHDYKNIRSQDKSDPAYYKPGKLPVTVGLVALFKMSLPLEYYHEKQGYLTEIPQCLNNEEELCPNTPSVDVYPRIGGEGASNPYFVNNPNGVARDISGEVTKFDANSLTLKTRKGTLYTVTIKDDGLLVYNRDFTGPYADSGMDATLKVGSQVLIMYQESNDQKQKTINPEQVRRIALLLEGVSPKKNLQPY